LIRQLADSVDLSKLIFEIPLVSVQEVHHFQGYGMWQWLLETFGPRLNIANVEYDDPLKLAAMRLGIGPDTSLKEGAFCRSLSGEFAKKERKLRIPSTKFQINAKFQSTNTNPKGIVFSSVRNFEFESLGIIWNMGLGIWGLFSIPHSALRIPNLPYLPFLRPLAVLDQFRH
jgi:hypothetical protein